MADTIVWSSYIDDTGQEWFLRRRAYYTSMAGITGFFDIGGIFGDRLPAWLKMRYVLLYRGNDHKVMPVARKTATAWTVRDGTLNVTMPNADGTHTSGWTPKSWFDEDRRQH